MCSIRCITSSCRKACSRGHGKKAHTQNTPRVVKRVIHVIRECKHCCKEPSCHSIHSHVADSHQPEKSAKRPPMIDCNCCCKKTNFRACKTAPCVLNVQCCISKRWATASAVLLKNHINHTASTCVALTEHRIPLLNIHSLDYTTLEGF